MKRNIFFIALLLVAMFMLTIEQGKGNCREGGKGKMTGLPDSCYDSGYQWHGEHGGPEEPLFVVAKTVSEWQKLWEHVNEEPPKELDAEKEMAIGIFLGQRPTGGYDIKIIRAGEESGVFRIRYRETRPEPDQVVTQVLTTPYLIRVFPATDLKVVAEKIE